MRTKRSKYLVALMLLIVLVAAACGGTEDSEEGSVIVVESAAGSGDDTSTDENDSAEADADADVADSETDAEPIGTDEEQALAFAQCMRDEGIDFPDPVVNADGSVDFFGGAGGRDGGAAGFRDDPNFDVAIDECGALLDGATFFGDQGDATEREDTFLELAQCLRDEGLDVSDPDFSGGFGGGGVFGENFDPNDPAAADAIDACQDIFAGLGAGGN